MIDNLLPNGAREIIVVQWVVTADDYVESPSLERTVDITFLVQVCV